MPDQSVQYKGWTICFLGGSRLRKWHSSWEAESATETGYVHYHYNRGEATFATKEDAMAHAYAEACAWIDQEIARIASQAPSQQVPKLSKKVAGRTRRRRLPKPGDRSI